MESNCGNSLSSIEVLKTFGVKSIAPGYTLPGSDLRCAISSHVTLGKLLNISEISVSPLVNGEHNLFYCPGLL